MRSVVAILTDTVRSQADLTELYFAQKADGADEVTLRRLQVTLLASAGSSRDIAQSAEALERRALAAVEGQLTALRSSSSDHPSPPSAA